MTEESKFTSLTQKQKAAVDYAIDREYPIVESSSEEHIFRMSGGQIIPVDDTWHNALREVYANMSPEGLDNLVNMHQAHIQVEKASVPFSMSPSGEGDNVSLPQKTESAVQR